jgi:hypothetical protein
MPGMYLVYQPRMGNNGDAHLSAIVMYNLSLLSEVRS